MKRFFNFWPSKVKALSQPKDQPQNEGEETRGGQNRPISLGEWTCPRCGARYGRPQSECVICAYQSDSHQTRWGFIN